MSKPISNFGNWTAFVFGAIFLAGGYSGLYPYLLTGYTYRRAGRSIPFELRGDSAALFYAASLLIGIFVLAAATKRLLDGRGDGA